jgi:hypothetical protein
VGESAGNIAAAAKIAGEVEVISQVVDERARLIKVEVKIAYTVAGELKPRADVKADVQAEIVGTNPGEIEDKTAPVGQVAGPIPGKSADTSLGEGARESVGQVEGTGALKREVAGTQRREAGGEIEDEGEVEGEVGGEVSGEAAGEAECGIDRLRECRLIATG